MELLYCPLITLRDQIDETRTHRNFGNKLLLLWTTSSLLSQSRLFQSISLWRFLKTFSINTKQVMFQKRHRKSLAGALQPMQQAWLALADFVTTIGTSESYWFTVVGNDLCSLSTRSGLDPMWYNSLLISAGLARKDTAQDKGITINKKAWDDFVTFCFPDEGTRRIDQKRVDLKALLEGKKQLETHRKTYRIIHIGKISACSPKFFSSQKDKNKKILMPPELKKLRASQRRLFYTVESLITDALIDLCSDITVAKE